MMFYLFAIGVGAGFSFAMIAATFNPPPPKWMTAAMTSFVIAYILYGAFKGWIVF